MQVFVYGTLRNGEDNHHMLGQSPLVAAVRTAPRFTLVDMGSYPALLEHGETEIVGELFEVDLVTLARLDLLEEVPEFYRRKELELSPGLVAMVYVLPHMYAVGAPIIAHGDWRQR